MRTTIFLMGIVLVILGPLLTLVALSSCLGTILSGHFLSCVTDFAYVVFGGVLFFVGIITAAVGAFVSDSPPKPPPYSMPAISAPPAQLTCKKCGSVYGSDRFFCRPCGKRPG